MPRRGVTVALKPRAERILRGANKPFESRTDTANRLIIEWARNHRAKLVESQPAPKPSPQPSALKRGQKRCPQCERIIGVATRTCRHCGAQIPKKVQENTTPAPIVEDQPTAEDDVERLGSPRWFVFATRGENHLLEARTLGMWAVPPWRSNSHVIQAKTRWLRPGDYVLFYDSATRSFTDLGVAESVADVSGNIQEPTVWDGEPYQCPFAVQFLGHRVHLDREWMLAHLSQRRTVQNGESPRILLWVTPSFAFAPVPLKDFTADDREVVLDAFGL